MSKVKSKAATKYDKAVANARGETTTDVATQPTAAELALLSAEGELAGALTEMSQEDVMAELASGDVEAAPMLVTLREGQRLKGILEGNGPEAEFTDVDEVTGEVKHSTSKTWIIAIGGGAMRASILDTVQLAKKLPPFLGQEVNIYRGRDKRSGTRTYTDYLVWGPKDESGKPRDWSAVAPVSRQLPATTPKNDQHEELLDEVGQ